MTAKDLRMSDIPVPAAPASSGIMGNKELQLSVPIPQQSVHDVLNVAIKMARRSCRAWTFTWGHGPEMDAGLDILRDALKISDRLGQDSAQTSIGLLLLAADFRRLRLYRKGKRVDADLALEILQEVRRRDPMNQRAAIMMSFFRNYQFSMLGERWLLDESIELIIEVLVACENSDLDMIDALMLAAASLAARAETFGSMDDLDVAIELLRLGIGIQISSDDAPARLRLQLAEALATRYDVSEHSDDLSEAEDLLEATIQMEIGAAHAMSRNFVKGRISYIRFEKFRTSEDIVASFRGYSLALKELLENGACPQPLKFSLSIHVARVARVAYHNQFAASLMISAPYAIAKQYWADAVDFCSDWGSKYILAEAHVVLGEIQLSRYNRVLALDILDDSISHFRQSVKLSRLTDVRFRARAARLSASLRVRFKLDIISSFHVLVARQEAISWVQEMFRAARPFKPTDMQECLIEVGDLIQDLHQGPPTIALLDRANSHYIHALRSPNWGASQTIDACSRIARILTDKGDITGYLHLYEKAKSWLDIVTKLAKEGKFQITSHLSLLARLYETMFWKTWNLQDGRNAAATYFRIIHKSQLETGEKITAARRYTLFYGRLIEGNDTRSQEALRVLEESKFASISLEDAIKYIVNLMLQLISDGATRRQQLMIIRGEANTPLLCVRYCRYLRKSAFEIIQLYERSRSVLWDRLVNSKTQVDMLEDKYKELAIRYRDLRRLLADPEAPTSAWRRMVAQDRYHTAADLNDVINEIQSKPGFENFLLPPLSEAEMQDFASHGPVIYLVAGSQDTPGLALMISLEKIAIVNLPGYTDNACRKHYNQLQHVFVGRDSEPELMDQTLTKTLEWLWYNSAEPVLRDLDLASSQSTSQELPRVWWVTCNWISRLPIHAAGDHKLAKEKGIACSVMDYVISSYTPTLRALNYLRTRFDRCKQQSSVDAKPDQAVVVAMQKTPDRHKLPNAVPEAVLIREILSPRMDASLLLSPKVTRKDVIQTLHKCTIAHLACHGEADQADPLRSKLLFEDWGSKPLRVGFLMRMELADCQLVFLSACQTAVNEDEALAEEGLHLSGAFQMAGVPNVIATSWNILDAEAIEVAIRFYSGLKDDNEDFDVSRSARSLHAALKDMRDGGTSPYIWGSYAHFGA